MTMALTKEQAVTSWNSYHNSNYSLGTERLNNALTKALANNDCTIEQWQGFIQASDKDIYKSLANNGLGVFLAKNTQATPQAGGLEKAILELVNTQASTQLNEKRVIELIQEYAPQPQTKTIEVKSIKGTHKVEGITHEKFDTILQWVSMNEPVYIYGPAGTGKNVICKQVADALGLGFYFTNAVQQEYKLTGFVDAGGKYHETQFYKAFKYGGLFFLDEMDGSIPEVLITLNGAIANGYFDFPVGRVDAHEDFRVISAGNTVGTGADADYTGRYQLDASTLDRFACVEVGYSKKIEDSLTDDKDLLQFAREYRKALEKTGIGGTITYRGISKLDKALQFANIKDALRMTITKGLTRDDINTLKTYGKADNKYWDNL